MNIPQEEEESLEDGDASVKDQKNSPEFLLDICDVYWEDSADARSHPLGRGAADDYSRA